MESKSRVKLKTGALVVRATKYGKTHIRVILKFDHKEDKLRYKNLFNKPIPALYGRKRKNA